MRPHLRLIGLLLLLSCSPWCSAQAIAPSASETRSLLLQKRYDELDQRFGYIQQAYSAGESSDENLRAAFRAFYDPDPALEPAYADWVAHSPRSYVAHLARGIYYKQLGTARRGDRASADTPSSQWAAMKKAHDVAANEFTASFGLDSKPILSYLHFIDIYAHRGDLQGARRLLEQALVVDPKTFIVREKYLGSLSTKWGGDTDLMRAFVEQCRTAGLSQNQMARLHAIVQEDEGWVRQYLDRDLDGAANAYRQASLLNPDANCAECGPAYRRAEIFQDQGEYEKAVKAASEVLKRRPDDTVMLDVRGNAYFKLGKGPEARADLLRAANLGDPWAQTMLAKLLLDGQLIPGDRAEAVRWLERAASANYDEAVKLLPVARDARVPIRMKP